MEWSEWIADGIRDLVLLAAGGGIAWLSGISAAKRSERFEREKREVTDSAERRQAVQRETRSALGHVYELERLVQQTKLEHAGEDVSLPLDAARALRSVADVVPDAHVRTVIDDFLNTFESWPLMVQWAETGDVLADDSRQFQLALLADLRETLAAGARGENPQTPGAERLRAASAAKDTALDAYWAQQAEDYEYFKSGRN